MSNCNKPLDGLLSINIELTSRCNKACWMCGRRKVEKEMPERAIAYGDMDFELVKEIEKQLPYGIVVQFHKDGEALLYPRFGEAVSLFKGRIRNIVTNGKLLVEKADEIIDNLETISVSIVENDPEADQQLETIKKFLDIKKDRRPMVSLRFVGDIDETKYTSLGLLIVRRQLHSPLGSFAYKKKPPTIPEIGICMDFLSHPTISREGDFSICVRFDPEKLGVIGNVKQSSIYDLWNSDIRKQWLQYHIDGKRHMIPLCAKCEYWGVPTSGL